MNAPMHPPFHATAVCLAWAIGALALAGCDWSGSSNSAADATDYEALLRAEAAARTKDPAWRPSHQEIALIRVGGQKGRELLHNFCVNQDGNLLVCWGGRYKPDRKSEELNEPTAIKVFTPDGKLLASWPLEFQPQAICVLPSGGVVVGGEGRLAKLDANGKVLLTGPSPALSQPPMTDEEIAALLKEWKRPASELGMHRARLAKRRSQITGLAATDQDLFVACAAPKGFAYAVYRTDHELKNPKLIVDKLSGCCGQMDIAARDGKLWVAHNGRHKVECFDRDGKKLTSFGRADRKAADGFGGCCEPKNLRVAANGDLLAAESGPPVVIKRFTAEGKFLAVVAAPTYASGCVRATVDVSPDGQRFYLLDTGADAIHVFAATNQPPASRETALVIRPAADAP